MVLLFTNPNAFNLFCLWKWLITLVFFVLLLCLRVIRAIHEGLHAIAAQWFGVPSSFISAKDTFVFVTITDKKTWYKITLYPLLFPFAVFLLFLPWNWKVGLFLSCVLATGSSKDLANLVMVSRAKGQWVSDTADGLFVYETPPKDS